MRVGSILGPSGEGQGQGRSWVPCSVETSDKKGQAGSGDKRDRFPLAVVGGGGTGNITRLPTSDHSLVLVLSTLPRMPDEWSAIATSWASRGWASRGWAFSPAAVPACAEPMSGGPLEAMFQSAASVWQKSPPRPWPLRPCACGKVVMTG
eukprot:243287-Chlamydomonas_euryale.AAC.10